MNNYELHLQTHTCHADCQNPICLAVRKAVAEEREACAAICTAIANVAEHNGFACGDEQEEFYSARHLTADDCAEAIRARSK